MIKMLVIQNIWKRFWTFIDIELIHSFLRYIHRIEKSGALILHQFSKISKYCKKSMIMSCFFLVNFHVKSIWTNKTIAFRVCFWLFLMSMREKNKRLNVHTNKMFQKENRNFKSQYHQGNFYTLAFVSICLCYVPHII